MNDSKETLSDKTTCPTNGCDSECCFSRVFKYYFGGFRQYACLGGRASRMEFASFFLINLLVSVLLSKLVPFSVVFLPLYAFYGIIAFTPFWAVATRRVHDTGRSGWILCGFVLALVVAIFVALFFIALGETLIGFIFLALFVMILGYLLFILFQKGEPLPNKYDTVPSHPYRDGTILLLLALLPYVLGFLSLLWVSQMINEPDVLPASDEMADVNDAASVLSGYASFENLLGNGEKIDNTVTVIEEENDEEDENQETPPAVVPAPVAAPTEQGTETAPVVVPAPVAAPTEQGTETAPQAAAKQAVKTIIALGGQNADGVPLVENAAEAAGEPAPAVENAAQVEQGMGVQ